MSPVMVVCVLAQEEQTRLALEKRQAEEEAHERVIAKRNTESDVQSVRERDLAWKRHKLEHSESIDTKLS